MKCNKEKQGHDKEQCFRPKHGINSQQCRTEYDQKQEWNLDPLVFSRDMINNAPTQIDQAKVKEHVYILTALHQIYPGEKEDNAQEGRIAHWKVGDGNSLKLIESPTMDYATGGADIND